MLWSSETRQGEAGWRCHGRTSDFYLQRSLEWTTGGSGLQMSWKGEGDRGVEGQYAV